MPYPPQRNIHDDNTHTGNAKRNAVNGIAGLDGEGDIINTSGNQALTDNLKNIANGIPGLDASTLLTAAQMASLFTLTRFKVGSFTRNSALEDGEQQITGVGFRPKLLIFIANISSTSAMSIGASDVTDNGVVTDQHQMSADTYLYNSSYCISAIPSNGNYTSALVDDFDSNGFTLIWESEGTSPTGTISITYIAFI